MQRIATLRFVSIIALASAGLGVVLMAVRAYYAISFVQPLHLETSGAEFESLFAIWKYINGKPVYTDPHQMPYIGAYYNWLYYAFYGEVTKIVLGVMALGDAWLPTVTRLITLTGTIIGAWVAYGLFAAILPGDDADAKRFSLASAVFLFFGPLVGFWAIATNPDVWPMICTLAGVAVLVRYYRSRPLTTILLVCALSYVAWSFKQIYVFLPGTALVYLWVKGDRAGAGLLAGILCAAGLATLAVGGPEYVRSLLFVGTDTPFVLASLLENLTNTGVKSLPVLFGLAGVVAWLFRRYRRTGASPFEPARIRDESAGILESAANPIALIGILVTAPITVVASVHLGASEHYYFALSVFLMSWMIAGLGLMRESGSVPRPMCVLSAIGWTANFLAVASVLAGMNGVLSNRWRHEQVSEALTCLNRMDLRQPVFVSAPYLALPWMVHSTIPFVISDTYLPDHAKGDERERGGVGGLLDEGFFGTAVLAEGFGGTFDGSGLKRYRRLDRKCGVFEVYVRKPE